MAKGIRPAAGSSGRKKTGAASNVVFETSGSSNRLRVTTMNGNSSQYLDNFTGRFETLDRKIETLSYLKDHSANLGENAVDDIDAALKRLRKLKRG